MPAATDTHSNLNISNILITVADLEWINGQPLAKVTFDVEHEPTEAESESAEAAAAAEEDDSWELEDEDESDDEYVEGPKEDVYVQYEGRSAEVINYQTNLTHIISNYIKLYQLKSQVKYYELN